jgi:hypothetical protein
VKRRFIVLDQNKLREHRAPEVAALLRTSHRTQFVLTDVAFIEMTKNPANREQIVKESLGMLAPHYARVHIAKSLGHALSYELKARAPSTNQMMYKEATQFARGVLRSVVSQDVLGMELQRVLSDQDEHHQAIAKDYFNHPSNKCRVAEQIKLMKVALSADFQRRLRAGQVSRDERLVALHTRAPGILHAIMVQRWKVPAPVAWRLVKSQPMLLRYFYSRMWLSIDWIRFGGFESLPAEKVSNDLIDHDYILTATCFDGLISAEKRVMEAYKDLQALLLKGIKGAPPALPPAQSGDEQDDSSDVEQVGPH